MLREKGRDLIQSYDKSPLVQDGIAIVLYFVTIVVNICHNPQCPCSDSIVVDDYPRGIKGIGMDSRFSPVWGR